MKNSDSWFPSKFDVRNGKLRASKNPIEVSISSRFVVDIVAQYYDTHLKNHVTGRLIDLGCGKVPLYRSYKEFASEVLCADWPASLHANPYLDLVCNLNEPLPLQSGDFDTIILSDVLEHIAKPENLWHELFRILRPNGKVILNVPFLYKLHETPHDYFRYTKYALINFAKLAGFKVITINETGGLPEVLTDLLAKLIVNTPILGKYTAILFQNVSRVLLTTVTGRKLSLKTREHFPLGYFMVVQK